MATTDLVQVVVDDVHVRYRTPSSAAGLRDRAPRWRRALARAAGFEPTEQVRALAGVSLVARAGEAVGVVGLNGSGKSTLLRVVAGLEVPHRGRVRAASRPVLLGVNAALVPELSGRENVRLGCLAMGMTPEAAAAAYPEVLEVAGIGPSIHRPMRTYSSGTGARLKFAIAAAADPRILLVDEALATGDAAFRERSEARMDRLRRSAGCVFLVSHAAQTVEETCTRAVWLHRGRVVLDGPARDVARRYRWWAWNLARGEAGTAERLLREAVAAGADTRVVLSPADAAPAPPRHARA